MRLNHQLFSQKDSISRKGKGRSGIEEFDGHRTFCCLLCGLGAFA
jgi:hypothetical protein